MARDKMETEIEIELRIGKADLTPDLHVNVLPNELILVNFIVLGCCPFLSEEHLRVKVMGGDSFAERHDHLKPNNCQSIKVDTLRFSEVALAYARFVWEIDSDEENDEKAALIEGHNGKHCPMECHSMVSCDKSSGRGAFHKVLILIEES
ncbi:hypothetical protein Tco_1467344 [Tanacetum coccineum]